MKIILLQFVTSLPVLHFNDSLLGEGVEVVFKIRKNIEYIAAAVVKVKELFSFDILVTFVTNKVINKRKLKPVKDLSYCNKSFHPP